MKRTASQDLVEWLNAADRRPLVLRGARQVGKTWLVRDLAETAKRRLIELNFERDSSAARAFESNDPRRILGELSLLVGEPIEPRSALLFLDEIQAADALLSKLRWFYEEVPELPVVAAGSLLELTLADHSMSMPVGRVTFRHIEPMGFDEYLEAHGQSVLLEALEAWRPGTALSPIAHEQARRWFERYAMVGGMPAVVAADVAGRSAHQLRAMQQDLTATYRADFAKYGGRLDRALLDTTLLAVARHLGQKVVYSRLGEGIGSQRAKTALERLAAARLCHIVPHTAANGLPLAAETKDRLRKALLVDVGVLHALLSTPAMDAFPKLESLSAQMRGQVFEQLVGQQLRRVTGQTGNGPELYYWQRTGGRSGEVNFIVQMQGRILPIEVKAGAAGAMKSLHQFMHDKGLPLAVRCDTNPPIVMTVDVSTTQGQPVRYQMLNLPHFLIWRLEKLIAERGWASQ